MMTTLLSTAELQKPSKNNWLRLVGWGLVLVFLAWSWESAEMRPAQLWKDAGNMGQFAADFFPPNFYDWRLYLKEMVVTVQIAVWGTVLAVIFGVPLGLMSSANIVPWWVYQPVRRLMDALRSINEMVFAMLFVVAVGLGPFAGTLALFVGTTGVLAKLFAEAVESIDPGPVEGIRATGASSLQEIIFGVIPQVLPLWISYVLLWETIRGFQFTQSAAILLIIIAVVSLIDMISQQLRRFFI